MRRVQKGRHATIVRTLDDGRHNTGKGTDFLKMHQRLVHFFLGEGPRYGFIRERGMRLKEALACLIELQKTESAAGSIHAKKKNLPVQIQKLEEEFRLHCDRVEAQRVQVDGLRKKRKEKDSQLQSGQDSLKRTRERLFDVKTNKEYQSMLKEIEIFEAKNSKLEDEVIALLDELEQLEKEFKVQESELEQRRKRFEEEKGKLEAELDSFAQELDACLAKSGEIRKGVPETLLRKYEQIKGVGRGLAVVAVWKEICDGCHMAIPPQMYNELQKATSLFTCPNCNRIIYWENRNGSTDH
jgi:predicted  nucleic acid-binding Zn-ribbon protein